MQEFLEACFRWPTLPATLLLIVAAVYWLFVIVGALDLELFDFDIDLDADVDAPSFTDIGFVGLRMLNIGDVPLMMWMSLFAIALWTASILIDGPRSVTGGGEIALAVLRNVAIAVLVTKVLTNPLRGKFDFKEPHPAEELIGGTCVITTSEASESFGCAHFRTEAAPLNIDVRTREDVLSKGDLAEIVDYDPERRVYYVKAAPRREQ